MKKNEADSSQNGEKEKNDQLSITNNTSSTYYEHKDGNGSFDFDLVFLREKGKIIKYLSFTINGLDLTVEPPQPNSATTTIGTKEDFEKFKNFIAQLEWE